LASGDEDDDERWQEAIAFLGAHNQSLDWVFFADPICMIIRLAEGTSSRRPPQLRVV
jgi:hypothetical protein